MQSPIRQPLECASNLDSPENVSYLGREYIDDVFVNSMNPLEDFLIGQVELDFLSGANVDRGAKEIRFSRSKKTKVEKSSE